MALWVDLGLSWRYLGAILGLSYEISVSLRRGAIFYIEKIEKKAHDSAKTAPRQPKMAVWVYLGAIIFY